MISPVARTGMSSSRPNSSKYNLSRTTGATWERGGSRNASGSGSFSFLAIDVSSLGVGARSNIGTRNSS